MSVLVHATSVAAWRGGRWVGVLLFGPSSSGKSDLGLRLIEGGWRLVSDDQTRVWTSGGRLFGRAPEGIAGRIEARGVGLLPEPALPFAELKLAVLCETGPVERLPAPEQVRVEGLALPCVRLAALEPSAVVKVSRALSRT